MTDPEQDQRRHSDSDSDNEDGDKTSPDKDLDYDSPTRKFDYDSPTRKVDLQPGDREIDLHDYENVDTKKPQTKTAKISVEYRPQPSTSNIESSNEPLHTHTHSHQSLMSRSVYTSSCGCCVWFVIGFIIIYSIFFYFFFRAQVKKADPFGFPQSKLVINDSNRANFDDNLRICKMSNENLPRPRSQREENLIIKQIKSVISPDCEYVFFGFTADRNVRYQSISGDVTWPSLKMMSGEFLPYDFKTCYEIRIAENGSLSADIVKNCNSKMGKRLLFLRKSDYDESCNRHRFNCIGIYNSISNNDVKTSFTIAKESNPNLLNLVPFDKNHPPEGLQLQTKLLTKPTIVMAVKYKFVYKFNNETQRYISNRFLVIDPEYDCIAYDIKRDKVVTRDCDDESCPVCSN